MKGVLKVVIPIPRAFQAGFLSTSLIYCRKCCSIFNFSNMISLFRKHCILQIKCSYTSGSFFLRHILATLHFNENLQREVETYEDGTNQVVVSWPKFKNGEATVRNIRVKPSFGNFLFINI